MLGWGWELNHDALSIELVVDGMIGAEAVRPT